MAAYRRVYDSRHLHADCQEPGSDPEPYARQSSMGYLYLYLYLYHQGAAEWGGRSLITLISSTALSCYFPESFREGLCNHRRWFVCLSVCLSVCYHDN